MRRNALVPHTRSFASFAALNEHLRAWCERERARHDERWQIERAALRELPAQPFSASVSWPVVASKVALVTVDRVRYSVPVACAGSTLRAESFVGCVELYRSAERVAAHARSHVRGATVFDLAHYLDAFARKPRACAALATSRSPLAYVPRARTDEALVAAIKVIHKRKPRWGYKRVHARLRREGHPREAQVC